MDHVPDPVSLFLTQPAEFRELYEAEVAAAERLEGRAAKGNDEVDILRTQPEHLLGHVVVLLADNLANSRF